MRRTGTTARQRRSLRVQFWADLAAAGGCFCVVVGQLIRRDGHWLLWAVVALVLTLVLLAGARDVRRRRDQLPR